MKKIRVNLVSETEFSVQGHGVHTAYLEMRNGLENRPDIELTVNAEPQKDADITHIHTVGSFAFRRLISHRGGKKVVSAHLIPDSLVGSLVAARLWMPFFLPYLRWLYNHADLVLAVSPHTQSELLKMGVRSRVEILENAIDTQKFSTTPQQKKDIRNQLGLSGHKFIVVGNGQIQPRKKFDTFLAVAKSLPDVQFVWVGGIPFKAAGADFINLSRMMKHPPKNVLVTGVIPIAEAALYMRASDAMLMPSTQETFGLAIVEGAASGLPVIVRDIHDYDETFGDLVLRGDETTFASLVAKLQSNESFYRRCQANSATLAKKYDVAVQIDRLVTLYRDITEGNSSEKR